MRGKTWDKFSPEVRERASPRLRRTPGLTSAAAHRRCLRQMHCGAADARHEACMRAAPTHGLPLGAFGYFSRWPRAGGSCVVRRGEQPRRPWQQSTSRTPAGMGCLPLQSGRAR